LFASPLAEIIFKKVLRFLGGWLITGVSVYIGIWHGRRLKAQGYTGENYYEKNPITRAALVRMIVIPILIVCALVWLDKKFLIFAWLTTWSSQASLVILRSSLCFLFAFQWTIFEDKSRLKRTLPLSVVALLIMIGVEIFVLLPATLISTHEIAPDGTLIQSTRTTCAPTALANILRLYGQPGFEKDVTLKMGTGMNGTSDEEACRGAKLLGFPDAKPWRPTLEEIASADLPLLVTIESEGAPHEVGLVGITSNVVFILDPYVCLVQYTHKDFKKVFQNRGIWLGKPSFKVDEEIRLSNFDPEKFRRRSFEIEKLKN